MNPQDSRLPPGIITVVEAMRRALAAYNARDWAEAERLCRSVLAVEAGNFPALNLLGAITGQTNRFEEAESLLERAVRVRPGEALVHNNHGNVLLALRRPEQALASYSRAVQVKPDYAEAHYNRALVLEELGHLDAACASHAQALAIAPDHPGVLLQFGRVQHRLRRFDAAAQTYSRALALQPEDMEAWNALGLVYQESGQFEAALQSFARALALNPLFIAAYNNQGFSLEKLGRIDAALESYDQALRLDPAIPEIHNNRGNALRALHRIDEALQSYERALVLNPDYVEAHYHLGALLYGRGQPGDALASYARALELDPGYAPALVSRGDVLRESGELAEAADHYQRALQLSPEHPWLYGIWLHTRMQLCEWGDLEAHLDRAIAKIQRGYKAVTPFALLAFNDSPALQLEAAKLWNSEIAAPPPPLTRLPLNRQAGRIRIGYYSADFHDHATAYLLAGIIETHDRSSFELIGFSFGPALVDAMRVRLEAAFDRFIDVRERSDREVAQLSRDLGVDIAVDLKGLTQDQRMGIFAYRAAPVQVNYLGYPGTTGAAYMDYVIADRIVLPPEAECHYTERVAYLPDSYQPNDRGRVIAPHECMRSELGLPASGFVFCCFNNNYKITPTVFDGWMRILHRVEGSVLWLIADNPTAAANLRREAIARDVDGARLIFAPRVPLAEHLARHRAADLFLDTYPCNAHTTASDALWAGLPLLTLAGASFAARVAASLLNAVGLPELVSDTQAQYEELAVELANAPQRLAHAREVLAESRLTAPLFDTARYTRHLEAAYLRMQQRHEAGLVPERIVIPS